MSRSRSKRFASAGSSARACRRLRGLGSDASLSPTPPGRIDLDTVALLVAVAHPARRSSAERRDPIPLERKMPSDLPAPGVGGPIGNPLRVPSHMGGYHAGGRSLKSFREMGDQEPVAPTSERVSPIGRDRRMDDRQGAGGSARLCSPSNPWDSPHEHCGPRVDPSPAKDPAPSFRMRGKPRSSFGSGCGWLGIRALLLFG